MRAWFLSDLHLKDINERNSIILLRFLRSLLQDPETTHLFLLGDIFDLWIGDSDVFQSKFQAIVDTLAILKSKGVEVVYFEGNHDIHVKAFWEERLSIPVYVEHKILELGPYLVRMEHGDFINPDDHAYMKYRNFIRKPTLEKIAYFVPGKVWDEIGSLASSFSRKRSSVKRRDSEKELREMIRAFGRDKFKEAPFDYIISGHMHIRDEYEFEANGKQRISINLGSWYDQPQVLCLSEKGHSWKSL